MCYPSSTRVAGIQVRRFLPLFMAAIYRPAHMASSAGLPAVLPDAHRAVEAGPDETAEAQSAANRPPGTGSVDTHFGYGIRSGECGMTVHRASAVTLNTPNLISEGQPYAGYANDYVLSKRHCEELVLQSPVNAVVLRPRIVLSHRVNGRDFAKSVLWVLPVMRSLGVLPLSGEEPIDAVSVSFVAEAVVKLLGRPVPFKRVAADASPHHLPRGRNQRRLTSAAKGKGFTLQPLPPCFSLKLFPFLGNWDFPWMDAECPRDANNIYKSWRRNKHRARPEISPGHSASPCGSV
jgi:hypothetical protein